MRVWVNGDFGKEFELKDLMKDEQLWEKEFWICKNPDRIYVRVVKNKWLFVFSLAPANISLVKKKIYIFFSYFQVLGNVSKFLVKVISKLENCKSTTPHKDRFFWVSLCYVSPIGFN